MGCGNGRPGRANRSGGNETVPDPLWKSCRPAKRFPTLCGNPPVPAKNETVGVGNRFSSQNGSRPLRGETSRDMLGGGNAPNITAGFLVP
jgi:hypothetical protein